MLVFDEFLEPMDPCTDNIMAKFYHRLKNFARDVAESLPRIYYYPNYQSDDTIPRTKNLLIQFEKSFKSMTKDEVYQSIIDSFKFNNKEEVIRWNSMRILSKWKQGI